MSLCGKKFGVYIISRKNRNNVTVFTIRELVHVVFKRRVCLLCLNGYIYKKYIITYNIII